MRSPRHVGSSLAPCLLMAVLTVGRGSSDPEVLIADGFTDSLDVAYLP